MTDEMCVCGYGLETHLVPRGTTGLADAWARRAESPCPIRRGTFSPAAALPPIPRPEAVG